MQKKETTTSSTYDASSNARINRLFARFSAIYGYVWKNQFKDETFLTLAKKEWMETLKPITDDNLTLAIEACKKRFELPPTLPAFYLLCRGFQPTKPENHYQHKVIKISDRSVAEFYLAKIREKLSSRKV